MTARARLVMFLVAALAVAAFFTAACVHLPSFGTSDHSYRQRAMTAALGHRTANVVSSINFDVRAFDTLGEEMILFGTVLGGRPSCCARPATNATATTSWSR
ncbi:hypothetical protein ACFCXR_22045 [Streptomyces noursei]|uniref:hypothetical protein n=1 Tax=Streptomyces noursei TaxID=1971 RepID=UPI0035DF15E4